MSHKLTPDNITEHIDKQYDRQPERYLPSWVALRMVRNGVNPTNFAKGIGLYTPKAGKDWYRLLKQKINKESANETPPTD